jgi:hypothetical protein
MKFQASEKLTLTKTKFIINAYGPIALVGINSVIQSYSKEIDPDQPLPTTIELGQDTLATESLVYYCVGLKTLQNAYYKKGNSPEWLGPFLRKHQLHIATKGFYKHYTTKIFWKIDYDQRHQPIEKASALLEAKQYHLFLKDNTSLDGYCYDYEGKPILRPFYLDYIRGRVSQSNYKNLKGILAILKENPQVSLIKVIEIPYYNASREGEKAIEFLFTPTAEQFKELYAIGGSFEATDRILQWLNIESFKKEEN